MSRAAFRAVNRLVQPLVKAGAGSPPPVGGGLVVLETTGHRSGLLRQVPLVAARMGNRVVVTTVRSTSRWMRNLEADPSARVWVDGRSRAAVARVNRGEQLSMATLTLADDHGPGAGCWA